MRGCGTLRKQKRAPGALLPAQSRGGDLQPATPHPSARRGLAVPFVCLEVLPSGLRTTALRPRRRTRTGRQRSGRRGLSQGTCHKSARTARVRVGAGACWSGWADGSGPTGAVSSEVGPRSGASGAVGARGGRGEGECRPGSYLSVGVLRGLRASVSGESYATALCNFVVVIVQLCYCAGVVGCTRPGVQRRMHGRVSLILQECWCQHSVGCWHIAGMERTYKNRGSARLPSATRHRKVLSGATPSLASRPTSLRRCKHNNTPG